MWGLLHRDFVSLETLRGSCHVPPPCDGFFFFPSGLKFPTMFSFYLFYIMWLLPSYMVLPQTCMLGKVIRGGLGMMTRVSWEDGSGWERARRPRMRRLHPVSTQDCSSRGVTVTGTGRQRSRTGRQG